MDSLDMLRLDVRADNNLDRLMVIQVIELPKVIKKTQVDIWNLLMGKECLSSRNVVSILYRQIPLLVVDVQKVQNCKLHVMRSVNGSKKELMHKEERQLKRNSELIVYNQRVVKEQTVQLHVRECLEIQL
jgi:hypothetical protein